MSRAARVPCCEIFFSHSSRDSTFVTRTVGVLRAHGLSVWYSSTNIVGAQQWHDEIGKALARCDWFVVALSPSSVKSLWVKRELLYALADARYDAHIVPVLYRPCNVRALSWTLPSFEMVDFTGDSAAACRSLLRVWGIDYQGPRGAAGRK
jgi:hypothetical protein